MKFNDKGYQIEFVCLKCGKEFKLDKMHYFGDDERLCDDCFEKFKKIPNTFSVKEFSELKD